MPQSLSQKTKGIIKQDTEADSFIFCCHMTKIVFIQTWIKFHKACKETSFNMLSILDARHLFWKYISSELMHNFKNTECESMKNIIETGRKTYKDIENKAEISNICIVTLSVTCILMLTAKQTILSC